MFWTPTLYMLDIYPIKSPEDLALVKKVAAEDGHSVLCPTHMLVKDKQVSGYLSMFNTPIINIWADSKRVTPRESFTGIHTVEQMARDKGQNLIIIPCSEDSPYYSYMEKMGYFRINKNVWFGKQLNNW